jgi:hypothetical protein
VRARVVHEYDDVHNGALYVLGDHLGIASPPRNRRLQSVLQRALSLGVRQERRGSGLAASGLFQHQRREVGLEVEGRTAKDILETPVDGMSIGVTPQPGSASERSHRTYRLSLYVPGTTSS